MVSTVVSTYPLRLFWMSFSYDLSSKGLTLVTIMYRMIYPSKELTPKLKRSALQV